METKKSIQVSFVILLIMTFIALIYAVVTTIQPALLVSRSFPLYTGEPWDEFLNASPKLAHYMLILERMAGGLGITASIGGLIVLLTTFRKVEKWAWYFILAIGVIGWGNNLVANILFKNTPIIIIIVVGLVLIAAGLIISANAFLCEKKNT